jgi:chemotaxis signal transduction protein
MQLVFFETGKERFGIPAFLVKEIMQPVPVTPVPHSPSPIAGIVNVRGHLLKVIDLFERLGLTDRTDTGSRRMIVIETEGREAWVIVVDRVIGMQRISSSQLSAPSGWNDIQRTEPWFQGIVTVNNGLDVKELSVMLDLEHMV